MTIWTPIIGRTRFGACELLVSVFGFPVAGSFGSFKPTMFPHRAPPQFAMATLALPFSVSQFPRGSPADAGVATARQRTVNVAPARILLMSVALPLVECFRSPCAVRSRRRQPYTAVKIRRVDSLHFNVHLAAAMFDLVLPPQRYLLTRLQ